MRAFIIILTLAALPLTACNTVQGIGNDMASAGNTISKTARNAKR